VIEMRFVAQTSELPPPPLGERERVLGLEDGADVTWARPEAVEFVAGSRAKARLELLGTGEVVVNCSSHSALTLLTRGRATAQVAVTGFAQLKVESYGESQPCIVADGHTHLLVLAYDCSRPQLRATDFSVPMVVVHDRAQPRCADWPVEWQARTSEVYIGQRLVRFATKEVAIAAACRVHEEWQQCQNRYVACQRVPGAIPKNCPNVVDVRWQFGTIHIELPGPGNPRAWYSPDAHDSEPLTEVNRARCTRHHLPEEPT
jgi:hypothetical protein